MTSPESGFTSVISTRRIVVLPEPEGPMMAIFSAGATSKSSSRSTCRSPKLLVTLRNVTMGSPGGWCASRRRW
jgi:hypothetical protein